MEVDDGSGRAQKVHADDCPDVEAVVHVADLDVEGIDSVFRKRNAVHLPNEDILAATDAA